MRMLERIGWADDEEAEVGMGGQEQARRVDQVRDALLRIHAADEHDDDVGAEAVGVAQACAIVAPVFGDVDDRRQIADALRVIREVPRRRARDRRRDADQARRERLGNAIDFSFDAGVFDQAALVGSKLFEHLMRELRVLAGDHDADAIAADFADDVVRFAFHGGEGVRAFVDLDAHAAQARGGGRGLANGHAVSTEIG